MIGQSQINVHSGGIKRLSSFVASIGILLIILVAGGLIEEIPVASLTGLMFVVVVKTFYWKSFIMYKSCLLYTSPSPRDQRGSRMPSSA